MRPLALAIVLFLVACGAEPRASAPQSASDEPAVATQSATAETCPDGPLPAPMRFRDVQVGGSTFVQSDGCARPPAIGYTPPPGYVPPVPVPMPEVNLKSAPFPVGPVPVPQRVALSQFPSYGLDGFGPNLMQWLDHARGIGAYASASPPSDEEWNSHVWPGPFQKVARAATTAKPATGRFFHFESARLDAVWALP